MTSTSVNDGQRGPADHNIREQIVAAANEHFSHYGYGKTTVSDLAAAIGFSKAYIYKFFDSKQAIGEAICRGCLDSIVATVEQAVAAADSPSAKMRAFFNAITTNGVNLFFSERKLYDIAAYAATERWQASLDYETRLKEILRGIILNGREAGEFERKTPLDETCRAIMQAMQPFTNPVMLQHNLDVLPVAASEVVSLILRSLAP